MFVAFNYMKNQYKNVFKQKQRIFISHEDQQLDSQIRKCTILKCT